MIALFVCAWLLLVVNLFLIVAAIRLWSAADHHLRKTRAAAEQAREEIHKLRRELA